MSPTSFDRPDEIVDVLAASPRPLLLATDVDGTLAPIAPRPEQARLAPGARSALTALASRPGVEIAVISGRSLAELRDHFGLADVGRLLGSYGAEAEHVAALDDEEAELLAAATTTIEALAAETPGARVEHKPVAVALHVRGATPDDARRAVDAARALFADDGRISLHEGHAVVEIAVRHVTKAMALAELRAALAPATVAFLGDDRADEAAFAGLAAGDVGVKIGPGPTAARWRVADPTDTVAILAGLAAALP